jgi:hypothetical protein
VRVVALDLLEVDLIDDEELGTCVRLERLREGVIGEAHVEAREHVGARRGRAPTRAGIHRETEAYIDQINPP